MSKAILIIDMPNSCAECPLFNDIYNDMNCRGANKRGIDYPYPADFRQEWCPLHQFKIKSGGNEMKKIKVTCPKCGHDVIYRNWFDWILHTPFHWFGKRRIKCPYCGVKSYVERG